MQLRGQLNLHLCASDRGVSETRKRDETTRKTLTFRCEKFNAYDRVPYTEYFISEYICWSDSNILWRVCRGDPIRKAVRPGVWLLHRGSTIQRGENWGCVGVKVDSCWYSPLCDCTSIKAMVAPVQFIRKFSSKLVVVATKTAIFSEGQREYKIKSSAEHYVDTMFYLQPYFSHKFRKRERERQKKCHVLLKYFQET